MMKKNETAEIVDIIIRMLIAFDDLKINKLTKYMRVMK